MSKFWRAWRADEIVSVLPSKSEEGSSITLRSGAGGLAPGTDYWTAIREIEAVLAQDREEQSRRQMEANTAINTAAKALGEVEYLRSVRDQLTAGNRRRVALLLMPNLVDGKPYLTKDVKEELMAILRDDLPEAVPQ